MSRIILNQIALQKIKVISETKKYFLLQPSSAAAPSTSNYGITPPTYTQTGYSGWSNTEPSYTVGDDRVLYELTETIYSDRTWDYSTPTISSSYKAAKEAYNEAIQAEEDIQDFVDLGLKQGYIWDNPTSKSASGTIPAYPAGSYIASGILSGGIRSINRSNSNTYGLNTWISTGGINLRYNAIDLMKLTTSNLFFYYPSTSTQQKKAISLGTNGAVNSLAFYGFNNDNKTMELTNNALTFYSPSNGTDKLATLNTSGLILSKGGIEGGSSTSGNGYIYLSTEDKAGITINGHTPGTNDNNPKWRAIIGSKFGVDSEGNLYANEAHISGTFTVKAGSESNIYTKDESDEKVQEEVEKVISVKEASGNIVHVEDASEYPALSLVANIVPKQSGSGTPSPENVREISGWESVETSVCGKNIFDESVLLQATDWAETDGVYSGYSRYIYAAFNNGLPHLKFNTNTQYTISFNYNQESTGTGLAIIIYYTDGAVRPNYYEENHIGKNTIVTEQGKTVSKISMSYGENRIIYLSEFQIELGTTATAYEPYTATTHNTDLGRTVYGGTVDVVSGVLTVTHALVDLGTLNWASASAVGHVRFDAGISNLAPNPTDNLDGYGSGLYCEIYATDGHPITNNSVDCAIARFGNRIYIRDDRYSSAADFKTAMNGVQLVYELAEPQTYTLTPSTINTLSGVNNVWADSGDVYLKYATMNPDMQALMGNATGTKADKTAALSRSQRIYYRSTSIQNLDSFSGPTTWLSTSGTGYENWSLSIPQLTNGEDSYPYLYTCVQNQTAAQYAAGSVCTCTPVVRDDSTTVIDGGSITTGVVSANYIDAAHLQIGKGQVDGLSEYMSYMTFEDGVLKITKPGFNYSVEIRNDGVYIVDPNNQAIASYKDYIALGTKDGNNIDIRSDSINFNIGKPTYAYVAQDKWFASNAEVSGAMYIDDYSLRQNANGDFVLGRRK